MSPWLSDLFLGSQSDERLVSLARAGHDRAFVAIVERYRRPLLAFAGRLGGAGRAEDVVQQAFLSAFVALQEGAEVHHLRGWLHQIVRNASIKSRARAPRDQQLNDSLSAAYGSEEEVEGRLMARSALADVARLPERQRDALVKVAVQGRSRGEVAFSMGLTDAAVRQLVHRARETLRAVATAITPLPLARWAASPRGGPTGNRIVEIAAGTGAASAGGVALKAGAIIASGVLASGVVALRQGGDGRRHVHLPRAHVAQTSAKARESEGRDQIVRASDLVAAGGTSANRATTGQAAVSLPSPVALARGTSETPAGLPASSVTKSEDSGSSSRTPSEEGGGGDHSGSSEKSGSGGDIASSPSTASPTGTRIGELDDGSVQSSQPTGTGSDGGTVTASISQQSRPDS